MKKQVYKIIFAYLLVFNVMGLILYKMIPILLNYPPDFFQKGIQDIILNVSYKKQYTLIVITLTLIIFLIIRYFLDPLIKLKDYISCANSKEILKARILAFKFPYRSYLYTTFIIPLFASILMIIVVNKDLMGLILKMNILFFTFMAICGQIMYIYTKKIFKPFLEVTSTINKKEIKPLKLTNDILIQVVPIFAVSILFIALIGYSRIIEENGNLISKSKFKILKDLNIEAFSADHEDSIKLLNNYYPEEYFLIIKPENNYFISNHKTYDEYFKTLTIARAKQKYERSYGITTEKQVVFLYPNNKDFVIGIYFEVVSNYTVIYFIVSFILLMVFAIISIQYFAKALSEDVIQVSNGILEIVNQDKRITTENRLPIVSNNEIADLVISFNTLLDKLKKEQERSLEQEKMLSIGQFIGGIAHNLKTPIFALSGNIESLSELIKEYKQSIYNDEVTKKDHEDIAIDMMAWVLKANKQIAYMNDVISTIKDQVAATSQTHDVEFDIKDLMKRVRLITTDSLRQHNCILDEDINEYYNEKITGSIVALVQVITNMIANSIDAYEDKKGIIEIRISSNNDFIYISVKDYAGGIKDNTLNKIFKEMYTSKGAKGTGLGLYISYTTIKSKFDGDIKINVVKGVSTEFIIEIPKKYEVVEI